VTGARGLDAHLVVRRAGFALDVRLAVAPGEVLALVGPNGAGKSTVLQALAGLVPLDDGHVRLDGATLDGPGAWVPPERRRCGVVFQEHRVLGHLTALEDVAFGLRARGVRAGPARAAAAGSLAAVGLEDLAARRSARLSGGQAQRVAIARALVGDPALLLLDEPFAALDTGTRDLLHSVVREHLARTRRPAVLVTHDPRDTAALADRVLELAEGRVVRDRPAGPAGPGLVAVVVLAGGTGRRIGGGDKTALPVGGRPILHRLLDATAPLTTVVVADAPGAAERAAFPHARWVRERPAGGGPAAALAAGVAALPDDVDVVVALAGDHPFAGAALPRLLARLAGDPSLDAAVGVDGDGREQPLVAAYRAAPLRDRLRGVRAGAAVRPLLAGMTLARVPLSAAEALDVDTPQDLATARGLAAPPARQPP
jgi:molybdate transport system ATP-binding protein